MEEKPPIVLNHIIEYWDSRTNAIEEWSQALADLPPEPLAAAVLRLAAGVTEHVRLLDDAALQKWAFVISDDLFKVASSISSWNGSVAGYL